MDPLDKIRIIKPKGFVEQQQQARGPVLAGMDPLAGIRSIQPKVTPATSEEREEEKKDLPWWADMALAAGIYGGTALALGAITSPGGGVGVAGTAAIAAPLYMGAKYALTGRKPEPMLTKLIPGSENIDPTVLGAVEETALWALTGPLFKGAGKAYKGLAKGVDKVIHGPLNPLANKLAPVGEWVWHQVTIPARIQLPIAKKSLQEIVIPGVERMEKSLPAASKVFREAAVERNLVSEAARGLGSKLQVETPQVIAQVGKGLRQTNITSRIRNPRAKEILSGFNTQIKDLSLNKRYERSFYKELNKLKLLPADTSAKLVRALEMPEGTNVREIHKALGEVIRSPHTSEKLQTLARDIYDLPARTPLAVARASREASIEYLTTKIKKIPGVVSSTLKPGYIESKFGSLKGLIIHRDVEHELLAMEKLPRIAEGLFNKFFMSPWKTSKVIMRPASHFRNMISNVILNDWGGLPFYRTDIYMEALGKMRAKDASWKEFQRLTGASAVNFTGADINQLTTGTTYGSNVFDKLLNVFDRLVQPMRSLYGAEESMFKYAKYLHNVEQGIGKKEAAFDAVKWTFNFSEVTPEVAQVGKWAIPFVRWYSKSIPLGLETAVKHPVRFFKWPLFGYALQSHAMEQNEISEDEWTNIHGMLPDYMQKGLYMLMPWRDTKGNLQLLDLTYMLPFFGDVSELYRQSPVESILQNPVFTMGSTLLSKEKFSGAPLYYDWEAPSTKFAKTMGYAWEQLTPAIAPGGTDWKKLQKAFTSEEGLTVEQAIAATIGLRLTPIDQLANARKKKAIRDIYQREIRGSLKRELKGAEPEEKRKVVEKYQKEVKELY